jgi:hypothetical protein
MTSAQQSLEFGNENGEPSLYQCSIEAHSRSAWLFAGEMVSAGRHYSERMEQL